MDVEQENSGGVEFAGEGKGKRRGYGENTPERLEAIATTVVDAGFKVHQELGPGLLESMYEECLFYELTKRGLKVRRQVHIPIYYDGRALATRLRIDLIVEECIIVDTKAVEQIIPLFKCQLRSYLKLARLRLGFIMNFNVVLFKDGVRRVLL